MRIRRLTREELRRSHAITSQLYPLVPSVSLWRAFEHAAYGPHRLREPVLDLGCGDGHFFRCVYPELRGVVGYDSDPAMLDRARASGVYRDLCLGTAQQLELPSQHFASVFANCSIEHMRDLPTVLSGLHRILRPGGTFLFSVVTDRFLAWEMLPILASKLAGEDCGERLREQYRAYQGVMNPLTVGEWVSELDRAGFRVDEHVPLAPFWTSRLFLTIDALWHLKAPGEAELGHRLESELAGVPGFSAAFQKIVDAVLDMETDWDVGSGAVFLATKA